MSGTGASGPAPSPLVLGDAAGVAVLGGELVANRLRGRPELRLLLPTGHTPLGMYEVLRARAAGGSMPADQASLFQLDEYLGLGAGDPRSYRAYLGRELRGVRFGAFHAIDGTAPDPESECARHQALLEEAPVDLVVLGLGRDGHVAFDEPGSSLAAGVRRVRLHEVTRADAAADFGGLEHVPREALTVGLRTLVEARELLMLVSGQAKAGALRAMLEGPRGSECPASLLRDHPGLTVVCDAAAAALLEPRPSWSSDRVLVVPGTRRGRLQRAQAECRRRPARAVILAGGARSDGISEAARMKQEWSVPDVPALVEDAGQGIAGAAVGTLPIVRAIEGVRQVAVVASPADLRARRAFAPYRKLALRLSFLRGKPRRPAG